MKFILTCPNGEKIDMTEEVFTYGVNSKEVNERIKYYKSINKK
jgi:hypothetical protein